MAAYAALVSLMNNIEQIQSHTRLPISFDQKQSESLLEKVTFLIEFLEDYNYHTTCKEMKDLESRIRDAAYVAEDIIETHVVDTIHDHYNETISHLTTTQPEKNNIEQLQSHTRLPIHTEQLTVDQALISLTKCIEQIPLHTPFFTRFDQNTSEYFLEAINFYIDFLWNYDYRGAGKDMKDLESRSRDAVYAAEDIIETHVFDTRHAHSPYIRKSKRIAHLGSMLNKRKIGRSTCLGIENVLKEMDFIKEEAMKMKDKKEIEDLRSSNPITGSLISSVPAGKNIMVGIDDQMLELMKLLTGYQSNCQVIPVVGMGGMGKTTLVKTAYEKPFISKHFDFYAWVSISQEYNLKKILLGLLPNESSHLSDNELGEKLRKTLYGRRYLVVLDDMWSVEAWEMVKLFLPDNNNCSRIIVTTRESSVSTYFGSSSIEMSFLDEVHSWELFCAKVFAPKDCPPELEEVGRKIVKNCKGLPLSIIVIGGLLAESERKKEYWEYIARDTNAIINSADNERCMKILSLSYQNLPVHLKPCFLYIGAFPEDEKIRASMLINLWVAEGFLKSNCSKKLEVLGEEYLNDLISRNLIMVNERGCTGKIKYCMIHDLLRDICLQGAQNEKFMYAPKLNSNDEIQFIDSQRRISLNKSLSEENIYQVLDTLRSGSMARTLICDKIRDVLPLQKFRLMKILNHTCGRFGYSLNDTFQLVNSRLIRINTNHLTAFPSTLCLLWNLQILIVSGISRWTSVPLEIWEMTELRHLQIYTAIYLPHPPLSQQMNTRATMKNLQTLKWIRDFRLSDEVVRRIPNIKKLKILISYWLTGKKLEEMSLKCLGLLKNLESLDLSFEKQISSDLAYLTFPKSLKKLSLRKCGLQWKDMSMIASLPHLEVLKLFDGSLKGPKWELVEEGFPCLKSLRIWRSDLVHWIAEDTSIPRLEHLHLIGLDKLVDIPESIGDIPTLQKIELTYCSKSAVISAMKILEYQEEVDNVSLKVQVYCSKRDDELESLASDNFLVHYRRY